MKTLMNNVQKQLLLLLVSLAASSIYASDLDQTSNTLHYVNGYAVASCFAQLNDPFLKDQGDRWAGAIVQYSGRYDFDILLPVAQAVKKEVAKQEMIIVTDDNHPKLGKELPLFYCYDIVLKPAVRAAINTAYEKIKKKTIFLEKTSPVPDE